MATGDKAAAAGLPVVPSTKAINVGYNDINAVADALADEMTARKGSIFIQPTQPAGTGLVANSAIWVKSAT